MIIIIDSDGLIGCLNANDTHHPSSQLILHKLIEKQAQILYPATVIIETTTLLQGRLNQPKLANQLIKLVNTNQIEIESIDREILQKSCAFIDIKNSKHHTLFDAVVATIAQKYHADAIFSFDRFYKTRGFKLAEELF